MPRNRRTQPEAEKRAELISTARALFLSDGYDATPMNRIAREAGVTPNTIYWYFRDKEQLLLAVLDELDGWPGLCAADFTTTVGAPLFAQFAKGGYDAADSVGFCASFSQTHSSLLPALDP